MDEFNRVRFRSSSLQSAEYVHDMGQQEDGGSGR